MQDRVDRTKFSLFGGDTNPFEGNATSRWLSEAPQSLATPGDDGRSDAGVGCFADQGAPAPPPGPAPLYLPQTKPLRPSLENGEGVWTTTGLPMSSPDNVLMAKTFMRPDTARPYASVGILLMDHRRVRLHLTGGTDSPGGDLGVKGPGVIPDADKKTLLAAWNGGFQGPHGGFGMIADGKQYRAAAQRLRQRGGDARWHDPHGPVGPRHLLVGRHDCRAAERGAAGRRLPGQPAHQRGQQHLGLRAGELG